jgi:hypothetical protein
MFTPHPLQKVFVPLGLLGGLVLASDGQAAARRPPIATLQYALRQLESANQTVLVREAEDQVAAALAALGAPTTVVPMPQLTQGHRGHHHRMTPNHQHPAAHNRRLLQQALRAILLVQRDLQGNTSPQAVAAMPLLIQAGGRVLRALFLPLLD